MRQLFLLALIPTTLILLLACSSDPEDILVGSWTCSGTSGNFSFDGQVQYVANGQSTSTFEFRGTQSGSRIEFAAIANGSWQIDGDQLIETVNKFTVVSFAVNGRQLPADAFPDQLSDAFVGATAGATIEQLNNNLLVARLGSDHYACSR